MTPLFLRAVLCSAIVCLASVPCSADNVYVNNVGGDDSFDGSAPTRDSGSVGPVKTLRRAVRLATFGDTIVIANEGEPYLEGLTLTGDKHSGNVTVPFRVLGNGATLSGLCPAPANLWRAHSGNIWSFEPTRKGRYMILKDGKKLERAEVGYYLEKPVDLPPGKFSVYKGRVFYKPPRGELMEEHDFAIAQNTTGISLYGIRNVIIQDLNVQHFRVDGVNAHDLCRSVLVRNVNATQNGRSGLTVTGSSRIVFRNCRVKDNAENSLRIMERGEADLQDSELDVEPSLIRGLSN